MKPLLVVVLLLASVSTGDAQSAPAFLPATPATVAWGYYSSQAKPVLTIHSGDKVRIQTLSTCGPNERLIGEGVASADIPVLQRCDLQRGQG